MARSVPPTRYGHSPKATSKEDGGGVQPWETRERGIMEESFASHGTQKTS